MTLLLGLDIGTTTIKAAVYVPELGRVVSVAARPTPVEHPQPGRSEHDPERLWKTVVECLSEVMAGHSGMPVDGLALASFGEAGLPLDADDRPLCPIIAWHDRRSEPQAAWWESQLADDELHAITGQRSSPSYGANKWLWIRDNWPAVAARTVTWLSVQDYVLWRLCGVKSTDYSIASRTLLFDQRSLDWSDEMLRRAGLTAGQLPRPRLAGTPVGRVSAAAAALSGVPEGTPCAQGGHDHLCASLAAGVYRPGAVADSSGTAEAITLALPEFHTSPTMARGGFACYAHIVSGQYVLKAGLKLAGGSVDWLARQLTGQSDRAAPLPYAELQAEAAVGAGKRAGPLWLPHWMGSGTPEGDRHSLAAMVGVRAEHERGDLFRALLESLACYVRHNVEEMTSLSGQPAGKVVLLGGTVRLELLTQLKADVLNRTVSVPQLPEAAATGAALLAGLGAGIFRSAGEAVDSLRYECQLVEPQPQRAAWYDALYRQAYRPLYGALREVNHALSQMESGLTAH